MRLSNINVLIGGNGVGKSNLISFFKLLNRLINDSFQDYVAQQSGADNLLYFGRKESDHISLKIVFRNGYLFNTYSVDFIPDKSNHFYLRNEEISFIHSSGMEYPEQLGSGYIETKLHAHRTGIAMHVTQAFRGFNIYHFHDTSDSSPIKQVVNINDNRTLREDGGNLSAFLYAMRETHPGSYRQIEAVVRSIAPFFKNFDLQPRITNTETIQLEWNEVGSDKYFNAHNLSDGTLRMMCLITLLLQPNPPAVIIIDEPELGLHPAAINVLARLLRQVSEKTQVIISTQSVTLLNQFAPDDIIVVERKNRQSTFRRLDPHDLQDWIDDYAVGEMWEKNILGGRP